MEVVKVYITTTCERCNGLCYLPVGEDIDGMGRSYIRHKPCPVCEGGGTHGTWITLGELAQMLITTMPAIVEQVKS